MAHVDSLLEAIDEPSLGLNGFDIHAHMTSDRLRELSLQYFAADNNLTLNTFDARPAEADWNDANRYLYLWVDGKPSAFAGWVYADQLFAGKKCVWITSLQGVYHVKEPKPVPPTGWARKLVQCIETMYADSGLSGICITPAEQNTWFAFGREPELSKKQQRMRKAYDETAIALGYILAPVAFTFARPCDDEVTRSPLFLRSVYVKDLVSSASTASSVTGAK